jgi:8-oxo-dGTP diphosphatase
MRNQIRDELSAIHPHDEVERQHLADALAWIDSGAELFRLAKPATPPKHLVSYFVVLDGDHALLVDHRNAQRWLPTGGHVEPGEHPRTTVVRELQEELGVSPTHDIDPPIMITCTPTVGLTAGHIDVCLWYVVRGNRDQAITFDRSEFNDAQWFAFSEVPFERADPDFGRFLAKTAAAALPPTRPAGPPLLQE